jgi:coenzyme F420-reducing hydrogenase delta subunit
MQLVQLCRLFVLKAFQEGADGVLVAGCHPGDCHYADGNYHARRRYALMHRFLGFMGIDAGRLRIDWVSASEGRRFAQVVAELTDQVRQLGPWRESMSESMETTIRVRARDLLEQEEVSCVIGYERGPRGDVRPTFVYQAEDAERLVWNQECSHNLMVYLHDRKRPLRKGEEPPRVAIVAKPCDVRALNVLLHEEQVVRERVFVIGIACPGMWEDGEGSQLQARCRRCKERIPVLYDTLVGEPPGRTGGHDRRGAAGLLGQRVPALHPLLRLSSGLPRLLLL